jgi:DNA (cytosine-5)-methyltransferase 1
MQTQTIPPLADRTLTAADRLAILDRVDEILELTHRSATLGNLEDPLEEAVYILLSRQTQEAAYQRVYANLRLRWPNWAALHKAPVHEVADVLKPAGFGPARARELHGLLDAVAAECKRRKIKFLTLGWLRDLSDEEAEAFLLGLPGIGPKSARGVMHYTLGRQVFAVDTHVRRILDRLDVVPDPGGKVRAAEYERAVPTSMRQRLHVNLIHHGRAFCRSRSPRCTECPLISFCRAGRDRVASEQSAAPTKEKVRRRAGALARENPVVIELFAGSGGLGEGFARAGFRVAIAVELDRAAAQTYRINHPGTVVVEADATAVTGTQLASLAPGAASPTAIIAGPPCQGYSAAGKRKADDTKNDLYAAVVKLAAELRPRFVVIENVPGLRQVEGRSFVETINGDLQTVGYNSDAHLLRACDFGVPQLRRRMLFLAQRADLGPPPTPPAATHCPGQHCTAKCGNQPGRFCKRSPTPTVLEALEGLPLLDSGQNAEYVDLGNGRVLLNGSTMAHSQKVIDKIKDILPGAGPISYRRLHPDVARTIVAGHRALPVHPILHRTLSVREAARIQGFSDAHVFCGKRSEQPLQVANAVPPRLGEVVALAIRAAAERGSDMRNVARSGGGSGPALL